MISTSKSEATAITGVTADRLVVFDRDIVHDKAVAVVKWVDGTLLDTIYRVDNE